MTPRRPKNSDAVTAEEVAAILGVGISQVYRYRRDGLLSRQAGNPRFSRTEAVAIADDPWLSGREAALLLGVSHTRVSQLANEDRIPFHEGPTGTRYYRTKQLRVVANARNARRFACRPDESCDPFKPLLSKPSVYVSASPAQP